MLIDSSTPLVFLDNHLARNILTGKFGDDQSKLCQELQALLTPPFNTRTTAASLMELLGITSKHIGKAAPSAFVEAAAAYEYFRACYDSEKIHKLLKEKKSEQEVHNNPKFGSLWLSLMADCFDERKSAAAWIAASLAIDEMQSAELLSNDDYLASLASEIIFYNDPLIRNCSKMRMAHRELNRFIQNILPSAFTTEQQDVLKAIKLKSREDYVDCDLIHLAVNGYVNKENKRLKVICATCDSPQTIMGRIGLYKRYMSNMQSISGDALPEDYEVSHNGTVHCFCLNSGSLVKTIDVQSATPAFPFVY